MQKIVEEFAGAIELTSKVDEGTTIKVNLPKEFVIHIKQSTPFTTPA